MKAIDIINSKAKYRDILYSRWEQMRSRCNNPSDPNYKNYGERGIKVCAEWDCSKYGFVAYYAWAMQNGFKPKLSIERKDVDGNYKPSNCEWIPPADQIHNRRCSIRIWDNDKYISMKTYCDIHKDTNSYDKCLRLVHKGVPPILALYYQFNFIVTNDWRKNIVGSLYDIILPIVQKHPSLVSDKSISLEKWVETYVSSFI